MRQGGGERVASSSTAPDGLKTNRQYIACDFGVANEKPGFRASVGEECSEESTQKPSCPALALPSPFLVTFPQRTSIK